VVDVEAQLVLLEVQAEAAEAAEEIMTVVVVG